jgi:hypothetical protein
VKVVREVYYGRIGENLFGGLLSPGSEMVSKNNFRKGDRVRVTIEKVKRLPRPKKVVRK